MLYRNKLLLAASAGVLFAMTSGVAQAADTDPLDEIVVTGVANSKGVRKQDAPFAITTATEEAMKDAAPSSTADLSKLVPGLFAEVTGGQSGPNIEVRGFPTAGDAPFVTFQLDGLPIFPVSSLSFLDNSTQLRLDDSVARLEGTIGGPAVLWGAAQPGATMSLIQKNGLDNPEGVLRFTTGSGREERVDGYYGGKVSDGWYASIGGFYTNTKGVRDTQYPSDEGYQLEGTITHTIDDGRIQAYARITDTNTQFFTPIPLLSSGSGSSTKIAAYPGFNPLTATLFSNANRYVTIDTAPGQSLTMDEGRGRGVDTHLFGLDFDKSWKGMDFSNKLSYYSGTTYSVTQFTGSLPETLGEFINSEVSTANANTTVTAATAGALATSGTATFAGSGKAITNLNTEVIGVGNWYVKKDITAFQDEGRVARDLWEGDRLTAGFYVSHYTSHDVWYLGNQSLLALTDNPQPIAVTLNNGVKATSAGGVFSPVSYAVNNDYTGDNQAAIIADDWQITDKLKVNAGFRIEHESIDATMQNTTTGDASTDPLALYDYGAAEVVPGKFTPYSNDWWAHAFSVGADYEVMKNLNAFVSYNQGYVMPTFDDVRNNGGAEFETITKVKQVQGGIKTSSDWYSAYLTGFYANFNGQPASQLLTNGTTVTYVLDSETKGFEIDTTLHPFKQMGQYLQGIELAFSGTYQKGTYSAGGPGITGNEVARQPDLQFRLTPSYAFDTSYGAFKLWATTTYVDSRWADVLDTQFLPSYVTEDIGASFQMDNGLELRFTGTNITNTLAITEGNSRVLGAGTVGGVFLGRPLFGATYEGSVAIHF
jgi:outer membrane receptor protein involved in Fe transport